MCFTAVCVSQNRPLVSYAKNTLNVSIKKMLNISRLFVPNMVAPKACDLASIPTNSGTPCPVV